MGRILVIAHRPMLRDALQHAIDAGRHDSISTCDAMIGLELAMTVHPDVVVVEHDGPVLDGAGVVRDLREILRDACPRVVLVAGEGTAPLAWLAAPRTIVVRKPYRTGDLLDAVRRAMPEAPVPPAAAGALSRAPPREAPRPPGAATPCRGEIRIARRQSAGRAQGRTFVRPRRSHARRAERQRDAT